MNYYSVSRTRCTGSCLSRERDVEVIKNCTTTIVTSLICFQSSGTDTATYRVFIETAVEAVKAGMNSTLTLLHPSSVISSIIINKVQ